MDTNLVLLLTVGVAWLLGIPRVVHAARLGQAGWLVVYALVLLFTGLGSLFWLPYFGTASACLFGLLVVLPSILQRQLWQLLGAQQYARALRVAGALRILHPADGLWQLPSLIAALDAGQRGDIAGAERGLSQIVTSGSKALVPQARVHLFRIRGDWQGYLDSTQQPDSAQLARDLAQLNARLRALGETGQLEQMVTTYAEHKLRLAAPANTHLRLYSQLFVAAFCGRQDVLERLFSGPLGFLGTATHLYWRGTCAHAAGDAETGDAALRGLLNHQDAGIAHGARLRLARPPVAAAERLSTEAQAQLDDLALQVDQEARFGEGAQMLAPRMTRALVALNLLAFVGEVLAGGSEDELALYRMGALVSGSLSADNAWRLLMALFLHLGPLHLAMNMLGLLVLGPFVETGLGRLRMLTAYLASGLTGSLIVASLDSAPASLFLGASGCIMGLLGATAAILVHGYRTERASTAVRRLWRIALVMLLQLGFDLTVPNISMTAHWSGIAMGALLGYVLVVTRRAR